MGLLWWKSNKTKESSTSKPSQQADSKKQQQQQPTEAPGMNGAVEVRRADSINDITVFEFGSVAASTDKVTLAGFCPVSDEFEPCRWEILPASDSNAPQFRVVF